MTIHTQFNNGRILTEDEMRKMAPSIFAETAHESRSAKFRPIPTIEVLRNLASEGFFPVSVAQSGSRSLGRRAFAKHLVRMRRFDDKAEDLQVGDTTAEFCLSNANDGTSNWVVRGGLFRVACLNGAIVNLHQMEGMKIRHMNKDPNPRRIIDDVIEGTYRVLEHAGSLLDAPRNWSQMQLDEGAQFDLATQAHAFLYRDIDGVIRTSVKPMQLLDVRRAADMEPNLWVAFNRIQEAALRGGIEAVSINRDSEGRLVEHRHRTYAITALDRSLKINTGLFDIARRFYDEHKEMVEA